MAEFEAFDPVCVTWDDAMTDATGQASTIQEALAQYEPTIRRSYGIFIGYSEKRGRKALVIAGEDDRDHDDKTSEACGGFSFIPVDMIVKISRPRNRKNKPKQQEKETT